MSGIVERSLQLMLRAAGYPSLLVAVANALHCTEIHKGQNVTVQRNCVIRGPVTLGDSTTLKPHCTLRGDITIDDNVTVGPHSQIDGDVTIGSHTNLNEQTEIIGDVDIGRYCAIARRTTLQSRNHVTNRAGTQMKFYRDVLDEPLGTTERPIRIGSDVWLGTDCIVPSAVEIGHGAIVGAGAVVTRDVPPYAIVAGVPAERVGWRFDETTREQLLDIEWWNWSMAKIQNNRNFFLSDLENTEDIRALITSDPHNY